jgi:hypothetical protein
LGRAQQPPPFASLSLERDHFVLNLGSKFLILVSYFDGLRAMDRSHQSVHEDFQYFHAHHIDGVRVLPNWYTGCAWAGQEDCQAGPSDSLFDADGYVRQSRLAVLVDLVGTAAEEGLVVDVTFDRAIPGAGMTPSEFSAGIVTTVNALANYPNVVIDIQNERDLGYTDQHLSQAQVETILDAIHTADGDRLVMASNTEATGDWETGVFKVETGLDVAAYHDPRGSNWYSVVPEVVNNIWYVDQFDIPVYLQEPQAWEGDQNPDHHLEAAFWAKYFGAAAWTFHTRIGHNLSQYSFVYKLNHHSDLSSWNDNPQKSVFDRIRDDNDSVGWAACNFDLSQSARAVAASGGQFTVTLYSRWWCSWNAYVEDGLSWVTFSISHGTDPSNYQWGGYALTVTYNVAQNSGSARTARLRIGNQVLTLSQAGI